MKLTVGQVNADKMDMWRSGPEGCGAKRRQMVILAVINRPIGYIHITVS